MSKTKKKKLYSSAAWSPFNVFRNDEYEINECILYVRVSSKAQLRRGDGLASQERMLREYARYKGYKVIAVFSDDMTGGSSYRRGLHDMLTFIRQYKGDRRLGVLFDGYSRMARGVRTHEDIRDSIFDAGGIPEGPGMSFGRDADSRMSEYVMASTAQHQREKNAEQTVSRMRARLLNGYWVFADPIGYEYKLSPGSGKVLVREEPVASIIQEALEGYASGYLDSQAEVKRFLEAQPAFMNELPNNKLTFQRVKDILTQVLYSGYIKYEDWEVSLRKGKHVGLITLTTFETIQDRLAGRKRAPARADLNEDFPLRGFILCGDCEGPLTANWSKGKAKQYPYYLCRNSNCSSKGKSIRRADLEGAFENLVRNLQPSKRLVTAARMMFKKVWNIRLQQSQKSKADLKKQIGKLEGQIEQLVDRIVETQSETAIAAFERRIEKLEKEKLLAREKVQNDLGPRRTFEEMFEHALLFLATLGNYGFLQD